jgi:hypothetical protein
MITDNLLYYIAICYNFMAVKYNSSLTYLECLSERVNKVLIGEEIHWLICNKGCNCIRKADVAPVNFPFAAGYLYNPMTGQHLQLNGAGAGSPVNPENYRKFEYIGGELRFMDSKYDITDWLNGQRWNGSVAPCGKSIALAWLIKNGLLGLMTYKEWEGAELNLVDSCGDDMVVKLSNY